MFDEGKENESFVLATISNVALPASKDELVITCFLRQRSLALFLATVKISYY